MHLPILSLLIWLPILGAVAILCLCKEDKATLARLIALGVALISLVLCIPLWCEFNTSQYAMQFVEMHTWIPALSIHYNLGVDGISMPLVVLSTFTTLIVVLAAGTTVKQKVSQYMAAFLVLQGMMVGVFAALDAMLFYVFWEGMLIPMYLCIGIWGSNNRNYASVKFFLYTFIGSILMLVAFLYLGMHAHSFDIRHLYQVHIPYTAQVLVFFAFLLGFAVKVPMWPVHTWLPDAHTEAPAGGSVILAALMLKMGAYGFLRFSMPIVPDACQHWYPLMIALSLIAIVYIGFVAIVQKDMKRLIAYSSVAHMGFATLGCFMLYLIVARTSNHAAAMLGIEGSMVQMISHAFSTGALFVGIGIIYEQMHTRLIKDYGGIVNTMPIFASFLVLFAMANVGLPGTSGFVGEFMVLLSSFQASPWITFAAASTLILSAAYTLWMVKRVVWGDIANPQVAKLKDIGCADVIVMSLLAVGVIGLGVYPNVLLNVFHSSVGHLMQLALAHKV